MGVLKIFTHLGPLVKKVSAKSLDPLIAHKPSSNSVRASIIR